VTSSGKHPAVSWCCTDCHHVFLYIDSFFWQTDIPKNDLEQALTLLANSVNNHTVSSFFKKASTAEKLYKNHLCNCVPGVIDIEHLRGVKRAREILERGLAMLNKEV
jgi:hypothetical protein